MQPGTRLVVHSDQLDYSCFAEPNPHLHLQPRVLVTSSFA